ncbi:MAG: beta-lactamase family protein [Anaerolineaceae bacterium]|nr:beta-lactamase family protein [Anaerolineaceae bacterium]
MLPKSPTDYSKPTDPSQLDIDADRLEKVREIFYDQIDRQALHSAAQLVVLRHGQVVLDLAHGKSRFNREVTAQTPFFTFSVTKAFTGVCVHQLIEQGKIEMDAPITEYWPEFGQKGKEAATIRHAFLHQAGIPAPNLNRQVLRWPFWNWVTKELAETPAVYPPGEKTAYHLVNYGFILGEVVRRVTGMPIDRYLDQHFIQPLGLKHTWMRIPAGKINSTPRLYSGDKEYNAAVFIFNRRINRQALIPAASLHSTARELAIFYQMLLNGGVYGGTRYLSEETLRQAITPGAEGIDHYLHYPMRYAYGFHLQQSYTNTKGVTIYDMGSGASEKAFGHYGMASSMAFADPGTDLVLTFTCNRLIKASNHRNQALLEALWAAVH